MPRANDAVAALLNEYAELHLMTGGDQFRARSYEKAARAIAGLAQDVSQLGPEGLQQIPGVGKAIAGKVAEIGETGTFAALEREGREWLAHEAPDTAPEFEHSAELRYVGQSFDVATPINREAATRGDLIAIAARFHARHERLYGHANPDGETEILALRIRVRGRLPRPTAVPASQTARAAIAAATRRVRFEGCWHEAPVFHWSSLAAGWKTLGPVVIEQETATVIVPPRFSAGIGAFGDLLLEQMS